MQEALSVARVSGDDWSLMATLNDLGLCYRDRGDMEGARAYLGEAGALCARIGGSWEAALLAANLAECGLTVGDLDEAERRITESLSYARALDHCSHTSWGLSLGAVLALRRGDVAGADARTREAASLINDPNDYEDAGYPLMAAAASAAASGDHQIAAQLWAALDHANARSGGLLQGPLEKQTRDEWLPGARDNVEPEIWRAAWDAGNKLSLEQALELAAGTRVPRAGRA